MNEETIKLGKQELKKCLKGSAVNSTDSVRKFTFFFSHSSRDQPNVSQIYDRLKRRCKIFYSERTIEVGTTAWREIEDALKNCYYCVFFVTQNFANSKFCMKELYICQQNDVTLIPILLEDLGRIRDCIDEHKLLVKSLLEIEAIPAINHHKMVDSNLIVRELGRLVQHTIRYDDNENTIQYHVTQAFMLMDLNNKRKTYDIEEDKVKSLQDLHRSYNRDIDKLGGEFLGSLMSFLLEMCVGIRNGGLKSKQSKMIHDIVIATMNTPSLLFNDDRCSTKSINNAWITCFEVGFAMVYDNLKYYIHLVKCDYYEECFSCMEYGLDLMFYALKSVSQDYLKSMADSYITLYDHFQTPWKDDMNECKTAFAFYYHCTFLLAIACKQKDREYIDRQRLEYRRQWEKVIKEKPKK